MHERFDLSQGHPSKVRKHLNLFIHQDNDIAVTLAKEASTLLRLQLVEQHMVRLYVHKVIQISGFLAFMYLGVVTFGSL